MAKNGMVRADIALEKASFNDPMGNQETAGDGGKETEKYDWEIDVSGVMCTNLVASGAFGRVYHGLMNQEDVAVKLMNLPLSMPAKDMEALKTSFKQEISVWNTLKHENIVQFIGASLDAREILAPPDAKPPPGQPFWAIITEFMSGGTLKEYINTRRRLPLKDALSFALDVARGIEYLHSKDIVHRDLKSENLLMDHKKRVKIADFGVARTEAKNPVDMTCETGTVRWMAPEVIDHKPYNRKVDVYSFGIVLWELVTCQHPFTGVTFVQLAYNVVNKDLRPEIPPNCNHKLAQLMAACWDKDAEVRPEIGEVVLRLEQILEDEGGPQTAAGNGCCIVL